VIACISVYLLFLATLDFFQIQIPSVRLSQILNGLVFCFCVVVYRKTDFSVEELGLKIKNYKSTFLSAIGISGALVALLMVGKLVILRVAPDFFPADAPFWNWNIGVHNWVSYIFSCIIQEFLARSMLYGSVRKLFDGKRAVAVAVALTTLLFGAVHLGHGFMYMVGAMVLLGSLGGLYEKQRNIWGVAIIHYVMGEAGTCLGLIL
jgi:membrane protease YdiL (CAAX protease family)